MAIGYPKDWVSKRTTLDEAPAMSKAVRRGGVDGSKYDFPHSSTGGHEVHESEVAPSIPARTVGHIGTPQARTVGHDPKATGKWFAPKHDHDLIGNAIATHPRLEPQGQAHSASGGKFGKLSKVPAGKNESSRMREDHGALAGDSGPRPSYSGGKGPIKP
jgi:hypothetical protein